MSTLVWDELEEWTRGRIQECDRRGPHVSKDRAGCYSVFQAMRRADRVATKRHHPVDNVD